MNGNRNSETVIYLCRYCSRNKRQEILPCNRRWVCVCGALYVLAENNSAEKDEKRLKEKSDGLIIKVPNGNFSLWSKNEKKISLGGKVMLVQKPSISRSEEGAMELVVSCPFLPKTTCFMDLSKGCFRESVAVSSMPKAVADRLNSPAGFDLIICRPEPFGDQQGKVEKLDEKRVVFFVKAGT
jgi:hypothetical protein